MICIIGDDFSFDGQYLSDFGLGMALPEEEDSYVSREILKGSMSSKRSSPNHYSTTYNDCLVLHFFVIKCADDQIGAEISEEEKNDIRAWLESPKLPKELVLEGEGNRINTSYFGVFNDVQPYNEADKCYGFRMSFTCDSPYGYTPEITVDIPLTSGSYVPIYFNNSAEKYEDVLPKIVISSENGLLGTEKIAISNSNHPDATQIELSGKAEGYTKLVIDCKRKTVTGETKLINGEEVEVRDLLPLSAIGVSYEALNPMTSVNAQTSSFKWLKLPYGDNKFTLTQTTVGNITKIEVVGRNIVKAGGV